MRIFVDRSLTLPADLDQNKPQGVQLHPPRLACHQLPPQGVHQPVGTSVQEQPELVGHEARATQPVGFYVELEVFDPILALAAPDVELVEVLGKDLGRRRRRGIGAVESSN